MKIMSLKASLMCDRELKMAKKCLSDCLKRMKGKYGTKEASSNIEFCISYIEDLMTDDKFRRDFYQQYRNPPNTPKSRRLGWYNPTIESLGWYKK